MSNISLSTIVYLMFSVLLLTDSCIGNLPLKFFISSLTVVVYLIDWPMIRSLLHRSIITAIKHFENNNSEKQKSFMFPVFQKLLPFQNFPPCWNFVSRDSPVTVSTHNGKIQYRYRFTATTWQLGWGRITISWDTLLKSAMLFFSVTPLIDRIFSLSNWTENLFNPSVSSKEGNKRCMLSFDSVYLL